MHARRTWRAWEGAVCAARRIARRRICAQEDAAVDSRQQSGVSYFDGAPSFNGERDECGLRGRRAGA